MNDLTKQVGAKQILLFLTPLEKFSGRYLYINVLITKLKYPIIKIFYGLITIFKIPLFKLKKLREAVKKKPGKLVTSAKLHHTPSLLSLIVTK